MYFNVGELLGHLHQGGDGLGLVVLDADDGLGSAGGDKGALNADHTLLGALQDDAVVGGDVRFAFGGVDDEVFALLLGLEHILDVRGEAGTAQTHDAAVFHTGDDLVFAQLDVADDVGGGVDALVPLVAFAVDDDGGFLVAGDIGDHIDLADGAGDGGVDVGAHEAVGLGDELAHLHLVALFDDGFGGGAEVLGHIDHGLVGQREGFHVGGVGELVGLRVDATHTEGLLA